MEAELSVFRLVVGNFCADDFPRDEQCNGNVLLLLGAASCLLGVLFSVVFAVVWRKCCFKAEPRAVERSGADGARASSLQANQALPVMLSRAVSAVNLEEGCADKLDASKAVFQHKASSRSSSRLQVCLPNLPLDSNTNQGEGEGSRSPDSFAARLTNLQSWLAESQGEVVISRV